jgi:hypothetical protein
MTKARVNADNASADIQGVTAGTGLSGGGTSGTVTLTNDMATTIAAKGDLVVGTGNDTYSALTVGSNGDNIVADSSTATGLRWQGNYAAGKNKIINGDFGIWQRGTSFTVFDGYVADRWRTYGSSTVTRETFTPGTAPVAGYEGKFFLRLAKPSGYGYGLISQRIEDVQTFAGQTITISFWAKVNSGTRALSPWITQNFGSGGSADVTNFLTGPTITTSWARYSITTTVPSISGKTVGAGSYLQIVVFGNLDSDAYTIDLWGVQVEAGSVATAFQTATGTLQGEIALAQRYFIRYDKTSSAYQGLNYGMCSSTTRGEVRMQFPVFMRSAPSVSYGTQTGWAVSDSSAYGVTTTTGAGTLDVSGATLFFNTTGLTAGRACLIQRDNVAANTYVDLSAEL